MARDHHLLAGLDLGQELARCVFASISVTVTMQSLKNSQKTGHNIALGWRWARACLHPLAHVEDAQAYKRRFGDRVAVAVIERASHAVIAEQPQAVSASLIAYARKL